MMMRLSDLCTVVAGRQVGTDAAFSAVSIDTRTLRRGELYVAIRGQRFDGHEFTEQAREAGAAAVLTEREVAVDLPQVVVRDTRQALGELAGEWRRRMGVPVVGVTGSNGKTTVKEMIASVLSVRQPVLATRGNLNNDIGVPLTLLALRPEHRIAVVEMGANHLHEIAYSSRFARHNVAVITNAGAAHIEGFGSLDGVARAKGELVEGLVEDGIAVLNADDRFVDFWKGLAGGRRTLTFGFAVDADVCGSNVRFSVDANGFSTTFDLTYQGRTRGIRLRLAGRHNVANALGAAAACLAAGAAMEEIGEGLARMQPVSGRLQPVPGAHGELIINDTYNANPSSLGAALEVLVAVDAEPWLALGAFGELGEASADLHGEVGRLSKEMGVARLYATGPHAERAVEAFGTGGRYFSSQTNLIDALAGDLRGGVALLVKGSRSQRMEKVVEALSAEGAP